MAILSRKPSVRNAPRGAPPLGGKAKLALARLLLEEAERRAAASQEGHGGGGTGESHDPAYSPIWAPDPDNRPQMAACRSEAQIIGYGGAAGGGKTDLLVGLAATQHQKSIIFRRESTQLKDIIRRAKQITEGRRAGMNHNEGLLTLDDGRTIEFGAMKDPDDWEKYKGRAHDLKAYDEPTEMLESQFRRSSAWLRTTIEGQRTRILLAFNPPTNVQGMWIIRYFAAWLDPNHPNPAKPGEIRWYATIDGKEDTECDSGEEFEHNGELVIPTSRTFFPARLSDNKYLMRTDYGRVLMNTPEPLRSQLLHGSFEASMMPDPWQVIPGAWVEAAFQRWRDREAAHAGGQEERGPQTVVGLDVAHGGKDKTVIAPRYGDFIDTLRKYEGKETPDGKSAAQRVSLIHSDGSYVNVDAIGYGASAQERLADSPPEGYGIPAIAINASSKSKHKDKSGKYLMFNKRAEMYWRLREELDPENDPTLCLPPDSELKNELCEARYEITTTGIKIESKDDIKERLGRSPDCGDAVAMTCLPNGSPHTVHVGGQRPEYQPRPSVAPQRPSPGIPGAIRRQSIERFQRDRG